MTAFNRVRIGLLLFLSVLIGLRFGPGAALLALFFGAIAFGYAHAQMSKGMLGAAVTTTNPSDFANRQQTFFNKKILKALQFSLKLCGYGLSEGYTTIGDTVRFFRPRKANLNGINAQALTGITIVPLTTPTVLTEGVKPTNLTEVAIGYTDIKMTQRAGLSQISDRATALDLFNTMMVQSKTMGEDAALDYDTVVRNWLINGLFNSNATFANGNDGGYFERFCGVVNTGNSAVDFGGLAGLSKIQGSITRAHALGVVTQLKTSKVPKIGGNYVAISPPAVLHSIRQDETWVRAAVFQGDPLYKDLELMLDGVAYVSADNPWVEGAVYGTESQTPIDAGLIYTTIFLGADAFGIPNLTNKAAGGTQSAPRMIVVDGPDKADPLNQQRFVGWKSFFGAGLFIATTDGTTISTGERPRTCLLRSKSTFA